MPKHEEHRRISYPAEKIYNLVADVSRYPDFLPWCEAVRIQKRMQQEGKEIIVADLLIAYNVFRERFTSRVTLDPETLSIDVDYIDGPFYYLDNHWRFTPLGNETLVHFMVDFEFKSRMLEKMISRVFTRAVMRMVEAFLQRAEELERKSIKNQPDGV